MNNKEGLKIQAFKEIYDIQREIILLDLNTFRFVSSGGDNFRACNE